MEDLGHNTQTTTGASDAGKQSLSRGEFRFGGYVHERRYRTAN